MDFASGVPIEPLPQRSARARRLVRTRGFAAHDKQTSTPTRSSKRQPKKQPRLAPTHFLALRLPSAELARRGKEIQRAVLSAECGNPESEKLLSHAIVDTRKLHLTLFVMHLKGKDIDLARSVLHACKQDAVESFAAGDPAIELRGVGTFRRDVLFIGVDKDTALPKLVSFHRSVLKKFENAGILGVDGGAGAFNPHATLMKKSQASRKIRKKPQRKALRKLRLQVPEDCCGAESFGTHPLHYLELNEMRLAEDGYYVTVDKVALSAVAETVERLCGLVDAHSHASAVRSS
eukprot:g3318.t1